MIYIYIFVNNVKQKDYVYKNFLEISITLY